MDCGSKSNKSLYTHIQILLKKLYVVFFLLLLSPTIVLASHSDDQCPDVHPTGNIDLSITVTNRDTGEIIGENSTIEPSTKLDIHAVAVAEGSCETIWFNYQTNQCEPGSTYERLVGAIHMVTDIISTSSSFNKDYGQIFGQDENGTTASLHVMDSHNSDTTGPIKKSYTSKGTYKVNLTNAVNETPCITENQNLTKTFTFHIGDPKKDPPCSGDSVGNPCDPATGNKYEYVVDYDNPSIQFSRSYSSKINKDFGLGYGWSSNHHKRLMKKGTDTIFVFESNGRSEPFTKSGVNWNGDGDAFNQLSEDATGYTVTKPNGATERYNLDGAIISASTPDNQTTTYSYNTSNQLEQAVDAYGHTLQFTYNINNRLESVTDPSNNIINYIYDGVGNLQTVTYQDTTSTTYLYENTEQHYITGILDENGDRYSTFDYSGDKATLTEHAITTNTEGQEKFTFDYSDWPNSTTYTDANNVATKVTLTSSLGRTLVTEKENLVDNKKMTRVYDASNNLTQITDEAGRITKHTYNTTNQKTSTTESFGTPLARTTEFEYLSPDLDLITKVITPSVFTGQTAEHILAYADPNVLLPTYIAETGFQPDGTPVVRAISMTYLDGKLATLNGPRDDVSDITTYAYYNCSTGNECGQLNTITNALGHVTTFNAYDAHGRVTKSTDSNGVVTDTVYDLRGRATSITLTAPNLQSRSLVYTYDDVGQLETATFPSGYVLTNTYDAAHDLRTITDNLGNRIEYLYDANGNRTDQKHYDSASVLKRHIDLSHDIRNREQSRAQGTYLYQTLYDAIGELDSSIDPGATPSINQWVYDTLGRQDTMTDALNQLIDFDYDVKDNLRQVIAANDATTVYSYDDLGNRLSEISPDAGSQYFTQDSSGNIIQKTDGRGLITTYSYDALNRLNTITYDDNSQALFQYDTATNGVSKLQTITDITGTTTYTYTSFGELNTKTQTVSGQSFTVTYNYDANGLLDSLQYPSGMVVDYNYNSNQINNINIDTQVLLNNITYDPFGPITGWTWSGGAVVNRTYDFGGFPTSYTLKSKTHDVSYDDRAQINALKDASNSTTIQSFDYDALYRITDYSGLGETRTFGYDSNGNRTSESLNATNYITTVLANSNRLQNTTGPVAKTFTYDNAGNTLNDGVNSYVYDVRNRLRSVNNNTKGYLINALGQRVMKHDTLNLGDANNDGQVTLADVPVTADHIIGKSLALGNPDCTNDSSVTVHDIVCINIQLASPPTPTNHIHFVYDEAGHLIGEYDQSGAVIQEYIWLQDIPVATRKNSTNYYIYTDHLTTPREVTDTTGTIIWRWESDPFGTAAPDEDPDNNATIFTLNMRFPGQYYDAETGLNYNWNRYYDPAIGRYIISDPIGLLAGTNTYGYVGGNPLKFSDPYGLMFGGGCWGGPACYFQGLCGPAGSTIAVWILDMFPNACGNHDKCFDDCSKTKQQCDNEFKRNTKGPFGPLYDYFATDSNKSQEQFNKAREKCDKCK